MIAIIKANFNAHITDLLLAGCTEELDAKNEAYKVLNALVQLRRWCLLIELLRPSNTIAWW